MTGFATILRADAGALPLADASVDLVVTSPPYFALRSYIDGGGHYAGQIGAEATPAEYITALVECTREWMRVLKPSGSIWVNLGDAYYSGKGAPGRTTVDAKSEARTVRRAGGNPLDGPSFGIGRKSLVLLPERYRIACVDQLGLIARAVVIWSKPNALPESVTDRVRRSHEDWVHLVRQPRYFSSVDEIRKPASRGGMTRRERLARGDATRQGEQRGTFGDGMAANPLGTLPGSVWEIATEPLTVPDSLGIDHFAAFPTEWPRRIILGWSPKAVCADCGYLIGGSHASGLLGVRREVRAAAQGPEVLQEGMFGPAHCSEPDQHELPPADDARVRGGLETRSSDGAEDRVHPGAPSGDGRTPRSNATSHRGSTSPQRGEDGQPDREPGVAGQDHPRSASEATAEAVRLSALWRPNPNVRHTLACAHCGGNRLSLATIVDPFGGTGTTALVAKALGRHGISVDRSADYCRLAEWRTTDPGQLAKAMRVEKPPAQLDGQVSLFDEMEVSA